jgi:DNA-binding XRE family transcriptional regulator
MDKNKRQNLEKAGWTVGDAQEFLGLTQAEMGLINFRLGVARRIRKERESLGWTQAVLAEKLSTSQSRVAFIESADASVSIDLLVRSYIAIGGTFPELGPIRKLAKRGTKKTSKKKTAPKARTSAKSEKALV